ncbi:putative ankyrin repeat protein [Cotonvirus japonicus]|uniref:Ankyrin repeat protein n=1 Tax=Cotonvirus japonicus TaxID=2811091 RepID=A0ABM7NS23_9VIRU|nr:putative ankyrin repeat protein [Cotonvirus japonicus]BCS82954.1 putative ankyrin repeat protein [Cotonvirus japonicus]
MDLNDKLLINHSSINKYYDLKTLEFLLNHRFIDVTKFPYNILFCSKTSSHIICSRPLLGKTIMLIELWKKMENNRKIEERKKNYSDLYLPRKDMEDNTVIVMPKKFTNKNDYDNNYDTTNKITVKFTEENNSSNEYITLQEEDQYENILTNVLDEHKSKIIGIIKSIEFASSILGDKNIRQEIINKHNEIIYKPGSLRSKIFNIRWHFNNGDINKIITFNNLELLCELGITNFDNINEKINLVLKFIDD